MVGFIVTLYRSPIQQDKSWFIVTYSYTFKCNQVLKLLPQKHWITSNEEEEEEDLEEEEEERRQNNTPDNPF